MPSEIKKRMEFRVIEPADSDLAEGNFLWYAVPESMARKKHKEPPFIHVREVFPGEPTIEDYKNQLDIIERLSNALEKAKEFIEDDYYLKEIEAIERGKK